MVEYIEKQTEQRQEMCQSQGVGVNSADGAHVLVLETAGEASVVGGHEKWDRSLLDVLDLTG